MALGQEGSLNSLGGCVPHPLLYSDLMLSYMKEWGASQGLLVLLLELVVSLNWLACPRAAHWFPGRSAGRVVCGGGRHLYP